MLCVSGLVGIAAACASSDGNGTSGRVGESQDSTPVPSEASAPTSDPSNTDTSSFATVPVATTPSDAPAASGWTEVDLGPALGDDYVSLAEHNGEVWLARPTSERDSIEIRNLAGDKRHAFADLGGSSAPQLRSTPFGLLLVTSNYDDFLPRTWLSTDDGATWSEGQIGQRPFDLSGLTVFDGTLLAPGAFRPETNPGSGPFTPGLFRSDDGISWTEVVLDRTVFESTDGFLGPIVVQGDRLVTTSNQQVGDYFVPVMFESVDGGASWQAAADAGPVPSVITDAGSVLVGVDGASQSGGSTIPVVVNSGRAWTPVEVSDFVPPFEFSSTFLIGGGPQALVSLSAQPTVEYCFEHQDTCTQGSAPALLLISDDGSAVSVDHGSSAVRSVQSGLVRADGSVAIVTYRDDRLVVRVWDLANGPVPSRAALEPFVPTGLPTVRWDDVLEVGKSYRFPLYTHCGIDLLGRFNDKVWWIVGAPSAAYDPRPASGSQQLLGEITVIDAETIEYRVDGELIATYAPKPVDPPGCD